MTLSELDVYMNVVDNIEDVVEDDNKFPVIKDNKIKKCCLITLESIKLFVNCVKSNLKNDTKKDK